MLRSSESVHECDAMQVLSQFKIIATATFTVTVLGRKLSQTKWLALLLLAVGIAQSQLSQCKSEADRCPFPPLFPFASPCSHYSWYVLMIFWSFNYFSLAHAALLQ